MGRCFSLFWLLGAQKVAGRREMIVPHFAVQYGVGDGSVAAPWDVQVDLDSRIRKATMTPDRKVIAATNQTALITPYKSATKPASRAPIA